MLHEYVFEVKPAAVCRVKAPNPKRAESRLRSELEGAAICLVVQPKDVSLIQARMDDASPLIVEIDGKEV